MKKLGEMRCPPVRHISASALILQLIVCWRSCGAQHIATQSLTEHTEPSLTSGRDALFGVAIGICSLVLFFFILSIVLAIFLFVCCVKLFKENDRRKNKGGDEEKEVENSKKSEDDEPKLHPLSGACSVESLTNGNFKTNHQYSKVEYKSDIERSSEITETPSSITDLTLYTMGYERQYSVVRPSHKEPPKSPERSSDNDDYDDIYQQPPSNEKDLYSQLAKRHYANIQRETVNLSHEIGKGEFGTVWEGEWSTDRDTRRVAIKTLNPNLSEKDRIRFLQEAVIIGQFRHPNIVRLLGVVKDGEPKMIVLELTTKGNLRDVLMNFKESLGEIPSKDLPVLLLKFSRQISNGMDYLAKKCFIHRDLAARNILMTEDYICKIADFGMARDLADSSCYMSSGGLIPVRWTAPEALNYGKFSTSSDVWSFGALLYEIWSLGTKPFEDKENDKVIELVQTGYRLPPPPGCPKMVYSLMISCWHPQPNQRPSFSDVRTLLRKPQDEILLLEEDVGPETKGLGGPLENGLGLYQELQNTYRGQEFTS